MSPVEVLGPKGPQPYGGTDMVTWAHHQLQLAGQIMDNPGGGLLFASQTIGQVKAAFNEADPERWQAFVQLLEGAEDRAVHRQFREALELLGRARAELPEAAPV